MVPQPDGPSEVKRDRCYELPSLTECRAAWDEMMSQGRTWPAEDDDDPLRREGQGGGDF
jgi:hypothetical protein